MRTTDGTPSLPNSDSKTERKTERTKLSRLVRATKAGQPDVDTAWMRLHGQLAERHRARARRRAVAVPVALLALAGSAAAGVVAWHGRAPSGRLLEVGHPFESDAKEVSMALPDGIHMDLGRHSRVGITKLTAEEIRVALGLGSARFEVESRPPRRFVVDVDDVEVRVVGTRFQVERVAAKRGDGDGDGDGARVDVSVQRGVVEVRNRRDGTEVHRLTAGQRFSTPISAEPFLASEAREWAQEQGQEQEQEQEQEDDGAPAAGATRGAPRTPGEERAARTPAPRGAHDKARVLLERAQELWRAGRMTEAAAYYEEVQARHPGDARAGLAALALGRIRMDQLGDLAGAVASFERASRLAPTGPVHEDALARLAQANARLGRASDCRRARDAYLSRYPDGIHAAMVTGACGRSSGSAQP